MAEGDTSREPVEALLDLLLYAPLGLVTQLDDLLPGLIERGRSQAAMAKTIGEFAVRAGTQKAQGRAEETQRTLEEAARAILGVFSSVMDRTETATTPGQATSGHAPASPSSPSSASVPTPAPRGGTSGRLPIAKYDSLKATEIIPLLDGLKPAQRASIEAYERSGRSRKTILNRLAQLSSR